MTPAHQPDPAAQPDPADPAGTDTDGPAEGDTTASSQAAEEVGSDTEPDWVRRRRLDAVFGDGAHGQSLGDRWYRDQVPPHHG